MKKTIAPGSNSWRIFFYVKSTRIEMEEAPFVIHGSEDSLDIDVLYFVSNMPDVQAGLKFCASKQENRNVAQLRDGIVIECLKGLPDEVNNSVFTTYELHPEVFGNSDILFLKC